MRMFKLASGMFPSIFLHFTSNTYTSAYSDDRSFPKDSLIEQSGPLFSRFAQQMGKPFDSIDKSKARIEAAGFKNIQEKWYKVPLGEWVKNPLLKEAGKFCKTQVLEGLEGYCMFLFTKVSSIDYPRSLKY